MERVQTIDQLAQIAVGVFAERKADSGQTHVIFIANLDRMGSASRDRTSDGEVPKFFVQRRHLVRQRRVP
jgi:hypothetical protein